jgi:hypothetical protein
MTERHHHYEQHVIGDRVDDPIITDPHPERITAREFAAPGRSGVLGE